MSIFGKVRQWIDHCLRWLMPSVECDVERLRTEINEVRQLRYEAALVIARAQGNGRRSRREPMVFTYSNRQRHEDMGRADADSLLE